MSKSSSDGDAYAVDNAMIPGRRNRHVKMAAIPPRFTFKSLFAQPVVNQMNLKSFTLPIFNLNNQYSINFHLAWLGFFTAFLSWFAFPPLLPEAITADLKLLPAQVSNSNIVSLSATLIVRLVAGPFVDRFGPRKVMAGLLVLGAIPSGMAGLAHNAETLYVLRFFIGILGGTFVPCLAWTTAFYDKNVVGSANALVGGWGNMGGGVTFLAMTGLYHSLTVTHGLARHVAWRASFAIVPVPILLTVAALTLIFGTDHPAGKWSQRHTTQATALAIARGHEVHLSKDEKNVIEQKSHEKEAGTAMVQPAEETDAANITSEVDVAVNEPLTFRSAAGILKNPLTWLPAFSYLTSFGYELAIDSFLVNYLFGLYKTASFTQLTGYLTSVFGLLNLFTRPAGGFIADYIYKRHGVPGKKYWMLFCAGTQGLVSIGLGVYISQNTTAATVAAGGQRPELATVMGLVALLAILNEMANGANFALVPHCNPYSNGVVSGVVGAFGNGGGIIFAVMFRFLGVGITNYGRPFYACGALIVGVNVALIAIRVPKW